MNVNPITRLDYPDPDVIRVEDTYYMVSTTMLGGAVFSIFLTWSMGIVSRRNRRY